jgi:hypothetical protein
LRLAKETLAALGLEELFFQLCCCVSLWFWREIGFGFTYLCVSIIFFGLGVTNDAAKPDCLVPTGDDGSLNDGRSSGKLICYLKQ